MDQKTVKASVRKMLVAIGEDPDREGLADTPRRVAEMYEEIFAGLTANPVDELKVGFELGHHEMIVVRDIPFYSMCEHHLLPFHGVAHVGYIPNEQGRVVGISKIARVVDLIARKPQIQERMVSEIADCINDGLAPLGVAVVIEAEHMCMIMRGIKKPGSRVITSALRGAFKNNPTTRAEFMSLVNSK
jgi:GTP cyclohydrolase I